MDFATRDCYRHVVEEIAKHSPVTEQEVARKAIAASVLARASASPQAERESHVGYFLIDAGRCKLERNAGTRLPPWTKISRIMGRFPLFAYLAGVLLVTA